MVIRMSNMAPGFRNNAEVVFFLFCRSSIGVKKIAGSGSSAVLVMKRICLERNKHRSRLRKLQIMSRD